MTQEEIKLRRLMGQHLLTPANAQHVAKDLCGIQAQFLTHALHALSIRCNEPSTDGLVKSWTNRGTMHVFSREDLPLFLHQGRGRFLRPVDTLEADAYLDAGRKRYFAELIVDAVAQGTGEREALKALCQKAGMTEAESKSLFDPWGGVIRALCEEGRICHKVQEKKAYQLCPPFTPMERRAAELELARRYFSHFGPATCKDAAYFFGCTQSKVKEWLKQLPVMETALDEKILYYIDTGFSEGEMPQCLFLAGFDQLMLGYEKSESLFLPKEKMREIFNLAGIVRPALLMNGTVAGWWRLKNKKLQITLFTPCGKEGITQQANCLWTDLKQIEFL